MNGAGALIFIFGLGGRRCSEDETEQQERKFAGHARTIAEMTWCWRPAGSSARIREIRGESGFNTSHGLVLYLRLIAEAPQPMDFWLATKPCHLPFGIVAMSLLSGLERLLARQFSMKKLQRLLVPESRQGTDGITVLLNQPLRLLCQPSIEHLLCAAIDSLIEGLPVGIKTETQNAEAAQGVAPTLPQFRHLLS